MIEKEEQIEKKIVYLRFFSKNIIIINAVYMGEREPLKEEIIYQ